MKFVAVSLISLVIFILLLNLFYSSFTNNVDFGKSLSWKKSDENFPGEKSQNLFWFVQVTDIHISRFHDPGRAPDLVRFCKNQLTAIKPDFVLATGDLTDAKHLDLRRSQQYEDEWQKYQETVKICQGVVSRWMDLRGNHDAFNIPDADHPNNLFRKYSSQGPENPNSYLYKHIKPFGEYTFIAVDGTPDPGPRRPFNFFGFLSQKEEDKISSFLEASKQSNMTVGFGHYPSSLVAAESGRSLKQVMSAMTAYLCGHLHTLADFVPRMYSLHRTGTLELELGDWKENRKYRVLAVDHDMLSFTDETLENWPVVMVTNPKHASFLSPHEPLYRMKYSSHIRILVFTPGSVNNIEVYIDDVHVGKAQHSSGPLFVLPWEPGKYHSGLHHMRVVVQDSLYNRHETVHPFSLDGTISPIPLLPRIILMTDIATVLQAVFLFIVSVYIITLVLLKNCTNVKIHFLSESLSMFRPCAKYFNKWLFRVWLVARTSKLFYSLTLFILFIAVGTFMFYSPWFTGEMIDGHTGVVFVWGMFVKNTYLPVCLTYFYGFFQVVTFNIPLLMYLGYVIHYFQNSPTSKTLYQNLFYIYFPLVVLIGFQSYVALGEFPICYGTRAFVLGPVRTGSVVLAIVLYRIARKEGETIGARLHRS